MTGPHTFLSDTSTPETLTNTVSPLPDPDLSLPEEPVSLSLLPSNSRHMGRNCSPRCAGSCRVRGRNTMLHHGQGWPAHDREGSEDLRFGAVATGSTRKGTEASGAMTRLGLPSWRHCLIASHQIGSSSWSKSPVTLARYSGLYGKLVSMVS